MTLYLLRNGSLAIDIGRRAYGCLFVHCLDLGYGCWIPPSQIRLRLNRVQARTLAQDGQVSVEAVG